MVKAKRMELRNLVAILMGRIGGKVLELDQYLIDTAGNGRVSVHFFFPKTHTDRFWVACRLEDWPDSVPYGGWWHGFSHWKQNLNPPELAPETLVEYVRYHFVTLGVSIPPEKGVT
jgi:hypothetical protein